MIKKCWNCGLRITKKKVWRVGVNEMEISR